MAYKIFLGDGMKLGELIDFILTFGLLSFIKFSDPHDIEKYIIIECHYQSDLSRVIKNLNLKFGGILKMEETDNAIEANSRSLSTSKKTTMDEEVNHLSGLTVSVHPGKLNTLQTSADSTRQEEDRNAIPASRRDIYNITCELPIVQGDNIVSAGLKCRNFFEQYGSIDKTDQVDIQGRPHLVITYNEFRSAFQAIKEIHPIYKQKPGDHRPSASHTRNCGPTSSAIPSGPPGPNKVHTKSTKTDPRTIFCRLPNTPSAHSECVAFYLTSGHIENTKNLTKNVNMFLFVRFKEIESAQRALKMRHPIYRPKPRQ